MAMKRKATAQPFRGSKPKLNSNSNNKTPSTTNNSNNKKSKYSQKNKLPPWVRKLMIPEKKCPDCRGGGEIIDDSKSGRKICTSCGLVLENSLISEQSEWRTFADGDKSGPDPNRVGAAQHYLLQESGDLSTTIGSKGNDKLSNTMKSLGGNASSSKLGRGIRDISSYCSRLSLPKDVQNFAGNIHIIYLLFILALNDMNNE